MERPHNLFRQQSTVSVGSSSLPLVGPNPRRWAVVISCPQPLATGALQASVFAHGVDTSTTGVKLSYTVPAGVTAVALSASMSETTGTTVVSALEWKRGTTVTQLQSVLKAGVWSGPLPLAAGDIIQWDVTTAVAASVTDFTIGVSQDQASQRVTIGFGDTVTLDNGLDLYPGGPPLVLLYDHVGQAIREQISAIAAAGTQSITVLDIFA